MTKRSFRILVFLILFLAIILRFTNYQNRWGLAVDQAHDGLVARYALETHKLPLLGPFSSAGPFQTGGEWYWIIMIGTLIYPFSILTPWIFITISYVFFVLLIIKIGTEFIDKKFGLLLGFLSAISTAQIAQSTSLTNESPLAFLSLLSIWMCFKFTRTKNALYLFLLGFFVSFAATIHLQGVGLILLVITTIIFTKYKNPKGLIYLLFGLILPLTPILISDFSHNFFNLKNMSQYYLHDQYKISLDVLGRRWLTYLGVFWPTAWGFIIGGNIIFGYLFGAGMALTTVNFFLKRKKTEWMIILASFIGIIFLLRYTRTPLFESYLVFIHPFVIFVTGFLLYKIVKKNLFLGFMIIAIISVFTLQKDLPELGFNQTNQTQTQTIMLKKILIDKYPNGKFAVYDYKRQTPIASFPLSLNLEVAGKIDDNGIKIGVATSGAKLNDKILGTLDQYVILNLNSKSKKDLAKEEWSFVNPSAIYNETEEWNKKTN